MLGRIVARDREAVGELYDRHGRLLFAIAFRILRERAEAEDALQVGFLRVWERADTYNPAFGTVPSWLVRLARNRSIDRLRTRTRGARHEVAGSTHHEPLHAAADESDATYEQRAEVAEALASVDPQARLFLECAYFEGYTQVELAMRFGVPLGTVKTKMRRALSALRQRYQLKADVP